MKFSELFSARDKKTAATVQKPAEIKPEYTHAAELQIRDRKSNKSLMLFIATENQIPEYRALAVQFIPDLKTNVEIFKRDSYPMVQENVVHNINRMDVLNDLKQFSKSPRATARINEKIQKLQAEADAKILEALKVFKEEAASDAPRWHIQQEMIGVIMSAATSADQKFKILHELTDITRQMNNPHKNILLLEIERRLEMSSEVQAFKSLQE